MPDIESQLKEYEDGFAKSCLEISKRRREAQAKLLEAYPSVVFNVVEAHNYLINPFKTSKDTSLSAEFKSFVTNLALEYGYDIYVNGLSFAGYSTGPMMIGGLKGQEIARKNGSLLPEGVLANDTDSGARLYASHICSYAEYDYGMAKVKITNPGSGSPIVETDPPGFLEEMKKANSSN